MLKYLLNISTSFFLFLLLALVFLAPSVHAETIQITDNTYNDLGAQIGDGKVVWRGQEGGTDNEIFLYDIATGTTSKITDNSYEDTAPQVNDGKIVWTGDPAVPGSREVFLYDIATGTTIQITNNGYEHQSPQVDNGKVMWTEVINGIFQVFLYDIATGTTTQISTGYGSDSPQMKDGKIVWVTRESQQSPSEIVLYDIATGTSQQITNDGLQNGYPQISDGKVTWVGSLSIQSSEIFVYDIATGTTTQITDNDLMEIRPSIDNGKVAWERHMPGNIDIYLYDTATGTTTQVTNTDYPDLFPQINDGTIAWVGKLYQFGNEINVYDIATGVTTQITQNAYSRYFPQLDGGKIVWNGRNDSTDYEIFLGDVPAIPPPVTTTFNSSADTYVKSGSDNRNTGAGTFMRLQSSGSNRGLVRFNQSAMQSAIGNSQVVSAKLQVTITDNSNNWGSTGRTIDVHRLLSDWNEGNGTEADRGTGTGATWSCAIDTMIQNQAKNCSGSTEWEMGQPNNPAVHPWAQTATATQTITNSQIGVVEFDVTSDVAAFLNGTNGNYGWIIKKTDEGQNGQVSLGTKESPSAPQLVVTYRP